MLTGGYKSELEANVANVARYDISGFVKNLDDLNSARNWHGCTQYTNDQGSKVTDKIHDK